MQPVDVRSMAVVLSEQVAEIKDRCACRRALGFVGYTDEQINHYLPRAQELARQHRAETAEQLIARANKK